MLAITRPRRQFLATVVLLAGTVAPTVVVGLWSYEVNRPGHRHDVEAELGRRLGLKVTIDGVRYPAPGQVVCDGVTLWQPETRRTGQLIEIAHADRVRSRTVGGQLVLNAEGLKLSAEGPNSAVNQVGELLRRGADGDARHVSLTAGTCELTMGDTPLVFRLREVAATYRDDDQGTATLSASYRLATPDGNPARCELVLGRERGEKVVTTLTLRTVDGPPLAAGVLDPFFDSVNWLGPNARVTGSLALAQVGTAPWSAEFKGELFDVELAAVLGERVPEHRLGGRARLTLDQARWAERPGGQGVGWVEARGTLSSGPGTISAGLLRALEAEMGFRLAGLPAEGVNDLAYQQLALGFQINGDGVLLVEGALGDAYEPGAVLIEPGLLRSLARAPERSGDLIGLRRTLGPVDPSGIEMVPTGQPFLDYLPTPPGGHRATVVGN